MLENLAVEGRRGEYRVLCKESMEEMPVTCVK